MSEQHQFALFILALFLVPLGVLCWVSYKERGTWRFWK